MFHIFSSFCIAIYISYLQENMPEYTQAQLREMIAPIKVIGKCLQKVQ